MVFPKHGHNRRSILFLLFVFFLVFVMVGVGCGDDDDDDDDSASQYTDQEVIYTAIQAQPAGLADPYYIWRVHHRYNILTQPLSIEDCQNWMELWRTGKAFWAIRMPDDAQILADDLNTSEMHVLSSMGGGGPEVVSQLNLRPAPERQTYAEENLPAATGEHWVAITGTGDATAVCDGEDMDARQWDLEFFYRLDFGGEQGAGEGDTLAEYYCYEGQEAPFFFPPTGIMARSLLNRFATQTGGVTCVGPFETIITSQWQEWGISGPHFRHYETSGPILFRYILDKPLDSYTYHFELDSELGAGWGFYKGDENGPHQPLQPVEDPFTTTASRVYLWAVGEVSADAADGQYATTLSATLTSPDDAQPRRAEIRTTTWLGDWTPPEPTSYSIYTPILLRDR
jgi:hypothetical protein